MRILYSLFTIVLLLICQPIFGQDFTLRIIHNNDGESKLLPTDIDGRNIGGAAAFKTVVDELKAGDIPSVMLSSGDNFLAGVAFDANNDETREGLPLFDALVLDAIGYDAICIGNHDFDFGPEVLAQLISDFQITSPPYLSANLDFSNEESLQALVDAGRIAQNTIVEVNGEQIGIIGLTTDNLASVTSPGNVTVDVDIAGVAQAQIDELSAAGINKIIVISHLQGIEEEISLASQLSGVDVIIAGGGDELLSNDESIALPGMGVFGTYPLVTVDADGNNTYIVTTPGEYNYVGNLIVNFDSNGIVESIDETSNPILVENVEENAELLESVINPLVEITSNVTALAITEVDLDGTRGSIRSVETSQGNLIADAFLYQVSISDVEGLDTDVPVVALTNGGGIRNNNIIRANSTITDQTTQSMLPFGNGVVILNAMTPVQFKTVLENSVAAIGNGEGTGRFGQIGGFSFVYDPAQPNSTFDAEGTTLTSEGSRVISATLDDGTEIIKDGEPAEGAPNVFIVTNDFIAAGRDGYTTFGEVGILAEVSPNYKLPLDAYLTEVLNGVVTADAYPEGGEGRITTGAVIPTGISEESMFELVGTYATGIFDDSGTEIVAHDPTTQQVFFTNAADNAIGILDISDPSMPTIVDNIDMSPYGDGVNSVAVANGIVAVASEAEGVMDPGKVVFFNTDGDFLNEVEVGVLPDMVTFNHRGNLVLTANEGEPSDDYTMDPLGSVSVINISTGVQNASVTTLDFESFNDQEGILTAQGVRIFGPGASVAQDLEPEYVTISEDDSYAFVVMQENNAMAKIDLSNLEIEGIFPLGLKDHRFEGNGLDASNRTDDINIANWPVFGMYQPDAIKAFTGSDGDTYIVTANEGDSRDYDGYSEEARIADLTLNSTNYPNAAELQTDEQIGRLKTTTATGTRSNGTTDLIHIYGGRSFSIWDEDLQLVWDSGDQFEKILAELAPNVFNSTNDDNDSRKNRSDDKGVEPEAIEIMKIDDKIYALIGLERQGGIFTYDITDIENPVYVDYFNNRNFTVDAESGEALDLGLEDIKHISAENSPNDQPLIVTANEVSGTISIFGIKGMQVEECLADGGSVSTADGENEVSQCVGDIIISMSNTSMADVLPYYYIITDADNTILAFANSADGNDVDLSAAPEGICRVWGYSQDGDVTPVVGESALTLVGEDICGELSENFVTVNRITGGECDDMVEPANPNCATPDNLTARPRSSSFRVRWDRVADAAGYVLELTDANGNVIEVNVRSNRVLVSSALGGEFTIRVRTICDNGEMSTYTSPITVSFDNLKSNDGKSLLDGIQVREELENGTYEYYPNPVMDELNYTVNVDQTGNVKARLIDVTGRILIDNPTQTLDAGMHSFRMDVSTIATGAYILEISLNGVITSDMVIKQ